jgi:hypothetical protein
MIFFAVKWSNKMDGKMKVVGLREILLTYSCSFIFGHETYCNF